MLVVTLLKPESIVGQTDVAVVVEALFWLELRSFLVVVDAFGEVLHDEGHSCDELVEDWVPLYVFECGVKQIVCFREIRHLAKDV